MKYRTKNAVKRAKRQNSEYVRYAKGLLLLDDGTIEDKSLAVEVLCAVSSRSMAMRDYRTAISAIYGLIMAEQQYLALVKKVYQLDSNAIAKALKQEQQPALKVVAGSKQPTQLISKPAYEETEAA